MPTHKEVGAILHGALAAIATPFAFVDIACGDAGQMKAAVSGTKAKHYHGIDLSEPALDLAAKNLAGVPFEVELGFRHGSHPAARARRRRLVRAFDSPPLDRRQA